MTLILKPNLDMVMPYQKECFYVNFFKCYNPNGLSHTHTDTHTNTTKPLPPPHTREVMKKAVVFPYPSALHWPQKSEGLLGALSHRERTEEQICFPYSAVVASLVSSALMWECIELRNDWVVYHTCGLFFIMGFEYMLFKLVVLSSFSDDWHWRGNIDLYFKNPKILSTSLQLNVSFKALS